MGDGGHVNAASGHIGGYQELHLTLTQSHQTAVAQALAQRAMQGDCREAVLLQVVGQAVALNLGAGKNNGLVNRGVAQQMVEQFAFVLRVVGPVQHLANVVVFFLWRVNLHALGLTHHAGSQLLNARRKRGAEHHGLAALDGELVDLGQIVGEAQVEHAVGFVHHQELNLVEFDLHGALQVEQATGRGHHQIGILQLGNLQLVRHTADHVGHAQATAMRDQTNRVVCDLLRQFAGRANDQSAGCGRFEVARIGRVFATGALWRSFAIRGSSSDHGLPFGFFFGVFSVHLLNQGVEHGQQERSGFAATGLARDHQVVELAIDAIGLRQRNGFGLNGGRLGVTQVFDRSHEFRRQAQQLKAVGFGAHSFFGLHGGKQSVVRNRNIHWNGVQLKRVSHVLSACLKRTRPSVKVEQHQPSNEVLR